jgi:hypothetical protein
LKNVVLADQKVSLVFSKSHFASASLSAVPVDNADATAVSFSYLSETKVIEKGEVKNEIY